MTFNKLGLEHLKLILSIIFSLQKPKRRNILSLILFLFCSLNIFAQAEIDSLKQLYTLQISEFERGKTIYKNVFSNLIRENPNLAKEAANRNYEISKNTKNLEAIANAEFNLSIVYLESSNYGVSLKYIYTALKGYEKIKTRQEALNDKEEVHNANSNIAKVYLTIAQIHYAMKSYKKAIEFCNKTIGLKEKMSEKDNLYYGVFLTRSNIASFLKDYSMAINDLNIAKKAFKKYPSFNINIEYNLADLYYDVFENSNADSLIVKLNIKNKKQLLDSALYLNKKVFKTAKDIKTVIWEAYAQVGFGKHAFFRKKYATSISHYKKAVPIFMDKSKKVILSETYNRLHQSYLALGDYDNALINYKKFINIKDTINSNENTKAIIELGLVYEHEKELQAKERKIKEKNLLIVVVFIGFVALIIIILLVIKRRRLIRDIKLRQNFSELLIRVQENEKERVSRELHDDISQQLLVLKNRIFLKFKKTASEEVAILDKTIDTVRNISHDLHPFEFEKTGLLKSIENLVDSFQRSSPIFYSHNISNIKRINKYISIEKKLYIYRILQESLVNVEKHSQSTACLLSVLKTKKYFEFIVKDNGKGFVLNTITKTPTGIGLKNLKDRVLYINGTLEIKTKPNFGTEICIRILK